MRRIITTLAVAAAFSATAQTTTAPSTSTTSTKSLKQKLQATPFSLSLLNDSYFSSKGADGIEMENYIDLKYKVDKYHLVKLSTVLNTAATKTQRNQEDIHTKYLQSDLSVTRAKILTEEKNGVSLSATQLNSFYNQKNVIADASGDLSGGIASRHSLSTSFSKKINNTLSLSSGQVFYMYNRNSGSVTNTSNYMTLSFTPTITLNDNFSISIANLWYKQNAASTYTNGHTTNEKLRFIPSVDYSNGDFFTSLYFDGYIAQSHDKFAGFTNKWHEKGYFGFMIGYTLF